MTNEDAVALLEDVIYADSMATISHAKHNQRRFVHYTSAETAISIIKNKEFWLRNSLAMNDYSEIAYGEALFRNVFYSESDANRISRETLNFLSDGLHERLADYFEKGANQRRYFTYLISVSEHGPYEVKPGMSGNHLEDKYGRLSMWRAYGRDSVGVALVLNPRAFLEPSDALKAFTRPVVYCEQSDFDHLYSSIMLRAHQRADELRQLPDGWFENNLQRFLDSSALALKHPGFGEEREWRVTYSANPDGEHIDDSVFNQTSRIKRQFVCLSGIPQRIYKIPFVDYPDEGFVGADINSLIEKVIIGPSQYPVVVADAIIMALKGAGVENPDEKIAISNIPLRT
jgi:hypothetical protein